MVNCFHSFKASWRLRSIRLVFQRRAFFYTKSEKQDHIKNFSKKSAFVKWVASSILLGYGLYEHDAVVWYAEVASRTILTTFTVAQMIFDYKMNYISSSSNLDLKLESEMTPSELAEFRALEMMHSCIHERNAGKLLKIVQKLGGIYIKLGQHIAALDYLLPPEYTRKFKILQDAAPQSSIDQVRRVIESEYKLKIGISRLEDAFDVFEEAPIGTASLAQVHRARLRRSPDSHETEIEPKWVAVKVQHEKLSRTASMDLAVVRQAVKVSKWLIPGFSLEWLAHEMQRNLPLEMDFFHEAKNAETLQDFISKDQQGNIIIPRIEWHFTTSRVLVMEYIDGIKVTDVESLQKNHISTSSVLFKIHSLFQRMIFHYGFLHCDPHPGNIMVLPASIDPKESNLIRKLKIWIFGNDWKLVILDHGLYKCLSLDLRNVYAHLWLNILQGNEHEMKRNFSTILDLKKFLDDSDSLRTTLDHARLYRLFSCILTQRSWDSIQKGILTSESSFFYTTPTTYASELALIKKRAPQYFHDTLVLLNVLPRDFLLLIKTNELLRYLDRSISLKENNNLSLSYLLVVKSALAFVKDFEKQSPWQIFKDYWSIIILLQLFRI